MVQSSPIAKWSVNQMPFGLRTAIQIAICLTDRYSDHHLVNGLPTGQLPTILKSVNRMVPLTECPVLLPMKYWS